MWGFSSNATIVQSILDAENETSIFSYIVLCAGKLNSGGVKSVVFFLSCSIIDTHSHVSRQYNNVQTTETYEEKQHLVCVGFNCN